MMKTSPYSEDWDDIPDELWDYVDSLAEGGKALQSGLSSRIAKRGTLRSRKTMNHIYNYKKYHNRKPKED